MMARCSKYRCISASIGNWSIRVGLQTKDLSFSSWLFLRGQLKWHEEEEKEDEDEDEEEKQKQKDDENESLTKSFSLPRRVNLVFLLTSAVHE